MTRLAPVNKPTEESNRFCGPAVISSIAGVTTDEAERLIQEVRKNTKPVTGAYAHEINGALELLGWKTYQINTNGRRSIYFNMMLMQSPGIYLFYVPYHVIVIEIGTDGKRYLIDNHTKSPISVGNSARLGQAVLGIVKVEKNA